MSKAKFTTKVGILGLMLISNGSASVQAQAPRNAPALPANTVPASAMDRLARLDQLHAEIEEAKLRAELAKANNDARTGGGSSAGAGLLTPPIPGMTGGAAQNLPPIPGGNTSNARRSVTGSDRPTYSLVEVWGNQTDRHAVIRIGGRDRIVEVGERISVGTITAITNNSVLFRDAQGRTRVIN